MALGIKNYYWLKKERNEDSYFKNQIKNPKESTIQFFEFIRRKKLHNKSILDLGCGNGANLIYLKKKIKNKKYCLGLDFNRELIKKARYHKGKISDLEFECENILNIRKKYKKRFDGIISMQTLSWLEDYKNFIKQIKKINTDFVAVSSLFWEGLIDFKIQVNFLKNDKSMRSVDSYNYYNIYSLKNYLNSMKEIGFKKNYIYKFDIPFSLKEPKNKNKMGTYTIKKNKKNLQLSGPILQNWYFIISKK